MYKLLKGIKNTQQNTTQNLLTQFSFSFRVL